MKSEPCLFKRDYLILGIYVDDGVLVDESSEGINNLLADLKKEFQVRIEEDPKIFIGMEIRRIKNRFKLKQ